MKQKEQGSHPKDIKRSLKFISELLQVKPVKKSRTKNPSKKELEQKYVFKEEVDTHILDE